MRHNTPQRRHWLWCWLLVGALLGGLWSAPASAQQAGNCQPSDLLILLDHSGSMSGSKWRDANTALNTLLNQFGGKLRMGFITFASSARLRVSVGTNTASTIRSVLRGLRASGNTAMVCALQQARSHYQSTVIPRDSYKSRRRFVVLITDGIPNNCGTNVVGAVSALRRVFSGGRTYDVKTYVIGFGSGVNSSQLQGMARAGGTGRYYQANNLSALQSALNQIAQSTSREVCDGLDNDCDGRVDEGLSRGCNTPCGPGRQTCSRGRWGSCSPSVNTRPELCNGKDDDCDGRVDENWPNKGRTCGVGVGACRNTSRWRCTSNQQGVHCPARAGNPRPETCNNIDDNCNGQVDESLQRTCRTACNSGVETCSRGRWVNCTARQPTSERCNGKDDDCDGQIDENWGNKGQACNVGVGACVRTGIWRCNSSGSGVACSAKPGAPQPERCDGIDNNCNGKVDEPWPQKGQACSAGVGACKQNGTRVCLPDGSGLRCSVPGGNPSPEVCDGKDNDCNGKVDDGLNRQCTTPCGSGTETCQNGVWRGCTAPQPQTETCNNQDDDCDGQVDNGITRACSSICGKGRETCQAGRWINCSARQPTPEVCDGLDNDCNGQIDELPPKRCLAACGEGTATCQNGQWSGCSGPQPKPETCNGKDDDCNGKVDDKIRRTCRSDCGTGDELCQNGQWVLCDAPTAQPERCNGKDDNCDGQADNGAPCPTGMVCTSGRCRPRCRNDECPGGMKCVNGICEGDACKTMTCPSDKRCVGGRCVNPCDLVNCPKGHICQKGLCLKNDCYVKGCPKEQRCVGGFCQSDPCHNVSCGPDQFCRDGKCIDSCANVSCQSDERCVDGACQPDPSQTGPCQGVNCPDGHTCERGKCVGDPCYSITCLPGRSCKQGRCQHDPCHNIECPPGQRCQQRQCHGPGSNPGSETPASEQPSSTDGGAPGTPDQGTTIPHDGSASHDNNGQSADQGPAQADRSSGTTQTPNHIDPTRYSPGCGCQTTLAPHAPLGLLLSLLVVLLGLRRRTSRLR